MLSGMRGTLVTRYFAEQHLREMFAGRLGETSSARAHSKLERWRHGPALSLGPATSIRAMFDLAAAPIAAILGFEVGDIVLAPSGDLALASLHGPDQGTLAVLATLWGESLDRAWRDAVRQAVRTDSRWCLCTNARELRLVDTRRSYARSFVEFDILAALEDAATFAVLWGLLRAEAFSAFEHDIDDQSRGRDARATVRCALPALSLFEAIVEAAAGKAAAVCRSLHEGVLEALGELVGGLFVAGGGRSGRSPEPARLTDVFEQAVTIAYRILFLLFAEARGLVPTWHPVYRRSYTVESLLTSIEHSGQPRGLWETLQAISRLVHAGCRAGDLRVPPFNGRLFAPSRTPLGETSRLDDETMRRVLLSLASQPGRPGVGRARIAYRDLGVEQLGAIYERVLDYQPRVAQPATPMPGGPVVTRAPFRVTLEPGGARRKATGSFYTPRSITDYLVRRTLHPLVEGRSAAGILQLRVLDPAMGSGAFLVSACRYLAAAHEEAVLRDGGCHPSDITEPDRIATRRTIAQRCLFGVDLNPMAVHLARLSIWLATLAADRPLTFLDHHLAVGDSLVGASLADLARQPPPGPATRTCGPPKPLPLFDAEGLEQALSEVLPTRVNIAGQPDDSLAVVRGKEAMLAKLSEPGSPLSRWKAVADLWCACWFWSDRTRAPGRAMFGELADALLGRRGAFGARVTGVLLTHARAIARTRRFFHWTFEFPEVFFDPEGRGRNDAGFDAVVSNPPWDMVRSDSGAPAGEASCDDTRQLTRFARDSGVYTATSDGHPNRFQLFVERAVRLARPGGRVGLVLPSGLATDRGCAGLRRLLLERCDTEAIVGLENAAAIFPIHRSVRFLALTTTAGARTERLRCRFGVRNAELLDAIPDALRDTSFEQLPLDLSPALLRRLSGNDLDIPDLRSPRDLSILERMTASFPSMASCEGWSARFGRELNATDDRQHLVGKGQDLPVIEGKQLVPFAVRANACRYRIPRGVAARLLDRSATFGRARLAYRDVAGAANRLTLIAAIVPAGSVTTHTLFCLKTLLEPVEQWFLCGILNSFVANYLVRPWITTHVRTGVIARLPVPRPDTTSAELVAIAALASALSTSRGPEDDPAYPRLQALVARLYRLTPAELAHVLGTFALVPEHEKEATRREFEALG